MHKQNEIVTNDYACDSGATIKTAAAHAVTLEQYVNEAGDYRSADVAIHNVTNIKQKTRTIPNGDINGKTFKVKEITITTADGENVLIKLFLDNSDK